MTAEGNRIHPAGFCTLERTVVELCHCEDVELPILNACVATRSDIAAPAQLLQEGTLSRHTPPGVCVVDGGQQRLNLRVGRAALYAQGPLPRCRDHL